MCIIIAKPAGVTLPASSIIENCWENNPDGAGFAIQRQGRVEARKGFMKLKHFKKALNKAGTAEELKALPMIFHFRITTHGGTSRPNTHPFPVSSKLKDLQSTEYTTRLAVAHNGVINSVKPRLADISDTMEYIMSQIEPLTRLSPRFYETDAGQEILLNATSSKWAFLPAEGDVVTVGRFVSDHGGLLFSNESYKDDYNWWKKYYGTWYDYGTWYGDSLSGLGGGDETLSIYPLPYGSYVFVEDRDGGMVEDGCYYGIDKQGNVYDIWADLYPILLPKARAYHGDGTKVKFNEDEALLFYTNDDEEDGK